MSKYTFEITGYGGEYVVGNISKESFDYFTQNDIDLDEYISDSEGLGVPEEFRPFHPDSWFDCDDIAHEYGSEMSEDSYITVYDDEGNEIWSSPLDPSSDDCVFDSACVKAVSTENLSKGEHLFFGHSMEKGSFFHADVDLKAEFDPTLLTFNYILIDDVPVFFELIYNEELIENDGDTGTSGSGNIFKLNGID